MGKTMGRKSCKVESPVKPTGQFSQNQQHFLWAGIEEWLSRGGSPLQPPNGLSAVLLFTALGMSSNLPKPRPNPAAARRIPSIHCWCALCRCAPEPAILGLEDNQHETLRGESRRIFILVATDLRLLSSTACPVRPYRCSLVCPAVVTACAPPYPSRCVMTLIPR